MYSRIVFYSVFCLHILYSLRRLSISDAASVRETATKHVIKNLTYFVWTRSSFIGGIETEKACKCVPFHQCTAEEDIFQVPNYPDACLKDDGSCCRVKSPLTTESPTIESTSEGSTHLACQCALSSECASVGHTVSKSSVVDCGRDKVCCSKKKLPQNTLQRLKCGERKDPSQIHIRGMEPEHSSSTKFGEFQFMASVWAGDDFVCGASLISSNMLLTAAHCVRNRSSSTLTVRVLDYNIRAETPEEHDSYRKETVSAISIHDHFDRITLENDLAIIKTTNPFQLDSFIFPVCTTVYGSEFADSNAYNSNGCFALGWGRSSEDAREELSATLKKVDLDLVQSDQCQEKLRGTILGPEFSMHSSYLCAAGRQGFDTCTGDGGGPLVCPLRSESNRYVQVGVTSFGVGCGNDSIPGVYASLEANNVWISSTYNKFKSSKGIL